MIKYDEVLSPFLALMEKELHANAGKGDRPGWLQMDSKTAILEVFYHMGKLHQAVHRGEAEAIKEYAADVANMCMMLVDVCGLLSEAEQPAPVAVEICKHCGWPHINETESCDEATLRERGKPGSVAATPKLEMAHVVRAHMEIPGCPVLTSNQCHALAMKLNESLNPIKP